MNYPSNTIVQNYNVNAGRVIQLPCFMDQPEPPDGFRAIVFATPSIFVGAIPNQIGPEFAPSVPCAIQFDLTQLLQQNALSRVRSIMINTNVTYDISDSDSIYLVFDSGLQVPIMPNLGNAANGTGSSSTPSDSCVVCDFLSASPIFALMAFAGTVHTPEFTVAVSNYKMDSLAFTSGIDAAGV